MTRDQKLITVLTAIAVLAGTMVVARMAFNDPPPVKAVERTVDVGPDGRLSIQFVGDTFLGDAAQPYLDKYGYDWPFKNAKAMLNADFTIATAEAAITSRVGLLNPGKKYAYAAKPAAAPAMRRAGIDAVTLSNNHVFDAGAKGLADTVRHTRRAGLASFGAGRNVAEAEQPLLLKSSIGTVGIVGIGESFGFTARDDAAGTVVLSTESVQRGLALARAAGADWVIAYVHWGDNYSPINKPQRRWAREFVREGYDLVIGSGPHSSQGMEVIDSVPVFYSIGNFVFGAPGRWASYNLPGIGLSVELELAKHRKAQLSVRCLLTDNVIVGYQARPCTANETRRYVTDLHRDIVVKGRHAVMPCDCFRERH
ncbi:MAG: CapA family protein [Micromonosporaceae bacterium]